MIIYWLAWHFEKANSRPSTMFHRFPTHLFTQLLHSWYSEMPWMERNFRASEVQQSAQTTVPENCFNKWQNQWNNVTHL